MQVGDINLPEEIIRLELQMGKVVRIIDFLMTRNPNINIPSVAQTDAFEADALRDLQKKYPNMGIGKA